MGQIIINCKLYFVIYKSKIGPRVRIGNSTFDVTCTFCTYEQISTMNIVGLDEELTISVTLL